MYYLQDTHFKYKDTDGLKEKRGIYHIYLWYKYHKNTNKKKTSMT